MLQKSTVRSVWRNLLLCWSVFHTAPLSLADEASRPLSTDRPDTTESPYTVPTGRFQIESSFFEFSRDRTGGRTERTWSIFPSNVKVGVRDNFDLQLLVSPLVIEDSSESTVEGIDDLTLRAKINVWGNDGGETALAVMPFLKVPTGSDAISNGSLEGGTIVPLAVEVTSWLAVNFMAELDFLRAKEDDGYELSFLHTVSLAWGLTEAFGAFTELTGTETSDPSLEYVSTFNTGFTYGIGEDLQFDAGVRFGLVSRAPDFELFTGVSVRF